MYLGERGNVSISVKALEKLLWKEELAISELFRTSQYWCIILLSWILTWLYLFIFFTFCVMRNWKYIYFSSVQISQYKWQCLASFPHEHTLLLSKSLRTEGVNQTGPPTLYCASVDWRPGAQLHPSLSIQTDMPRHPLTEHLQWTTELTLTLVKLLSSKIHAICMELIQHLLRHWLIDVVGAIFQVLIIGWKKGFN